MDLYVKGDYVHPNARGHRWIAQAVVDVLSPLVSERLRTRP
jgi:lysophospholipase L1-like esterase